MKLIHTGDLHIGKTMSDFSLIPDQRFILDQLLAAAREEKADAFVALPGGIGTLEELVEQMTWAQLGRHTKPILMLDIGGFWRPLLGLIAHMRNSGFVRPEFEVNYLVAERTADVIPMLKRAAARHGAAAPAWRWQ